MAVVRAAEGTGHIEVGLVRLNTAEQVAVGMVVVVGCKMGALVGDIAGDIGCSRIPAEPDNSAAIAKPC